MGFKKVNKLQNCCHVLIVVGVVSKFKKVFERGPRKRYR